MSSNGQNRLEHIPLSKIHVSKEIATLREVNRKKPDYVELVESVKQDGVFSAISVREVKNPENGEIEYALIDGLQRFSASLDAGKETIPAQIMPLDINKVLEKQIIANSHVITTPRGDMARGLMNLLHAEPFMTKNDLAAKLKKSVKWLDSVLSLNNLIPKALQLVNEEKLPLNNAYSLAKLPQERQEEFLPPAMTLSNAEFSSGVEALVKEIKEEKRQGKGGKSAEYTPKEFFRKTGEVKEALDKKTKMKEVFKATNGKDPSKEELAAMQLALQWVLNIDPPTVTVRKAEWEKQKEEEKTSREKKYAERKAEKDAEAKHDREEAEKTLQKLKEAAAAKEAVVAK